MSLNIVSETEIDILLTKYGGIPLHLGNSSTFKLCKQNRLSLSWSPLPC